MVTIPLERTANTHASALVLNSKHFMETLRRSNLFVLKNHYKGDFRVLNTVLTAGFEISKGQWVPASIKHGYWTEPEASLELAVSTFGRRRSSVIGDGLFGLLPAEV